MKYFNNTRAVQRAVLVGVIALAVFFAPASSLAALVLPAHATAAVTGLGFWETLGCIGCIAGFLVGAGTTLAGLAVFLAAHPELAVLCVSTCSLVV